MCFQNVFLKQYVGNFTAILGQYQCMSDSLNIY
jgi:hypothetical protein